MIDVILVFITLDKPNSYWIMSSDEYDSDASTFPSLPVSLHLLADNIDQFADEDNTELNIEIDSMPSLTKLDNVRFKLV